MIVISEGRIIGKDQSSVAGCIEAFHFFEIGLFVLLVELRDQLVFFSHFLWDLREEVEYEVFQRFFWAVSDEFFVAGS